MIQLNEAQWRIQNWLLESPKHNYTTVYVLKSEFSNMSINVLADWCENLPDCVLEDVIECPNQPEAIYAIRFYK